MDHVVVSSYQLLPGTLKDFWDPRSVDRRSFPHAGHNIRGSGWRETYQNYDAIVLMRRGWGSEIGGVAVDVGQDPSVDVSANLSSVITCRLLDSFTLSCQEVYPIILDPQTNYS